MPYSASMAISAKDFLEKVTKPCLEDVSCAPGEFHKMVAAIWAIDAFIEHYCWEKYPDEMEKNGQQYLKKFREKLSAFTVIHEASNSLKHAIRKGKSCSTKGSASIKNVSGKEWGGAEWDNTEWSGTFIDYISEKSQSIESAIEEINKWVEENFYF